MCISQKTGAIYIADTNNHRIQRWYIGDSQGVTIAGDPTGISGMSNTLLSNPRNVALSPDEKQLFVSDTANNRIQIFELP